GGGATGFVIGLVGSDFGTGAVGGSQQLGFTITNSGTASLILVVTIGMTGKQYILGQIQAIGANMVYAYYEGGSSGSVSTVPQDLLTVDDLRSVREQVPGISYASPMVELHDRISVGGGKERDILVLGVSYEYYFVRNLIVVSGRFFDEEDTASRTKVVITTDKFAKKVFGSTEAAVGKQIKLSGLPFTIIGTFRERVETFGQSEIAEDTLLIPYTVARFFTGTDYVKQIFFSMADSSDVERGSEQIRRVIQSRHRPESVYHVENLTQLLDVAAKTANALTAVLLLVAAVTLIVSGVGIMNIMLATVSSRIREIGVRKAVGATNREIKYQFMAEAMFISISGGIVGIIIGLALPFSVRFLTSFRIPISGLSAIIAIIVSTLVGVLFGTVPATRAAQLDPVESLRWE
ncbi:MAG TPA: ABC transporter permease, partial [Terriglobales bacterium]|nr:ABC transporter permease [Terriglobales bacterium]